MLTFYEFIHKLLAYATKNRYDRAIRNNIVRFYYANVS